MPCESKGEGCSAAGGCPAPPELGPFGLSRQGPSWMQEWGDECPAREGRAPHQPSVSPPGAEASPSASPTAPAQTRTPSPSHAHPSVRRRRRRSGEGRPARWCGERAVGSCRCCSGSPGGRAEPGGGVGGWASPGEGVRGGQAQGWGPRGTQGPSERKAAGAPGGGCAGAGGHQTGPGTPLGTAWCSPTAWQRPRHVPRGLSGLGPRRPQLPCPAGRTRRAGPRGSALPIPRRPGDSTRRGHTGSRAAPAGPLARGPAVPHPREKRARPP